MLEFDDPGVDAVGAVDLGAMKASADKSICKSDLEAVVAPELEAGATATSKTFNARWDDSRPVRNCVNWA